MIRCSQAFLKAVCNESDEGSLKKKQTELKIVEIGIKALSEQVAMQKRAPILS
jgi:hypothetical protein